MGKFDGVLLVSDYDDTLADTAGFAARNLPKPEIPRRNLEALRYFMENGGRFGVITGRAWQIFRDLAADVPMNAPCGVGNGAGLIDPQTERFLYARFLPEDAPERLEEIRRAFPDLACELYRADHRADAVNPNDFARGHASRAHYQFREIASFRETEPPLVKALFEGETEELERIRQFFLSRSWAGDYEITFSGRHLLEMTAKGANKGEATRVLAGMLGISMDHVYSAGDHQNDLSMLAAAREGFAPASAIPAVFASGATIVSPCPQGALADVVEILDRRYGGERPWSV